jgi:hypothetical protein
MWTISCLQMKSLICELFHSFCVTMYKMHWLFRWLLTVTLVILTNYPFKSIRSKRLISLANVFVLFAATFIMAVKFAHVQWVYLYFNHKVKHLNNFICRSTLFVHLLIVLVFLISEWTTGFIVWQLLVLNPLNYSIAVLCQLIGYKLGTLSRSTDFDHSMLLYAAFSATFFYTVIEIVSFIHFFEC